MKNIPSFSRCATLATLIVCAGFSWAQAQVAGRYAAPMLRVSPYARQVAMGEAFTALANDISVMRYNVGGLGSLTMNHKSLSFHFHQWIDDTYQGAIEGAIATRYGGLGLSFGYFDEGEITALNPDFSPVPGTFNSNDLVLSLGYGNHVYLLNNKLSFGAALKGVRQDLVSNVGTGIGLDLGALYWLDSFSVGATLQNFTLKKLQLGGGGSANLLPETIRAGVATHVPIGLGSMGRQMKWSVGLDASKFLDKDDKDIRLQAGTEIFLSEVFAARGGYKFHNDDNSRWGAGFGLIIPMNWFGGSSTHFDYAYSPLDAFDSQAHRFSLSFNFGTAQPQDFASARGDIDRELAEARRARQEAEEARLAAKEAEERIRDLEAQLAERLKMAEEIVKQSQGKLTIEQQPGGNIKLTMRDTTNMINFDFDKSVIRRDMFPILYDVTRILKEIYSDSPVGISGHCDNIGTDEYNIKLAERRINSVIRFLVEQGISSSRFFNPIPYGEWMPLNDNSTEANRFRNRRVEFLIYTGENKPELPRASKIEQVYVLGDTVNVVGNGYFPTFTTDLLRDPTRLVLKFSKMYIADPLTVEVNRGTVQRARLGYHPEDASTWIVLDMLEAVQPEIVSSGKTLKIVTNRIAGSAGRSGGR